MQGQHEGRVEARNLAILEPESGLHNCIVEMGSGRSPLARCPFGVGQGLRFLSESQHTGQRFVDGFGGGECLLDFGLQNNHVASLRELLVILTPHANPKLLALQFWNVLVIFACRWFFHIGSPFAH